MDTTQLKRIADAIEEILRLVKKDQEDSKAKQRQMEGEQNENTRHNRTSKTFAI